MVPLTQRAPEGCASRKKKADTCNANVRRGTEVPSPNAFDQPLVTIAI